MKFAEPFPPLCLPSPFRLLYPLQALSGAGAPGSSSSDKSEKQRGNSPWFSRHGSTRSVSSCPATPGDAGSRKGITARSPEVDYGISHGKDHDSTSCGERRWSPTPTIQAPLMDVLENKSQEPMSLRSMLRFARENVSGSEQRGNSCRCHLRLFCQKRKSVLTSYPATKVVGHLFVISFCVSTSPTKPAISRIEIKGAVLSNKITSYQCF